VQDALSVADKQTAVELVQELHGYVRVAVESPYANYVVQKVIEVMPRAHTRFILEELRHAAAATARHRYGCRILCRLLEYAISEEGLAVLVDEVLAEAGALCFHFFGHHVLQHVLEHGSEEQRHRVAMAICPNMARCAQDSHGSFIVEAALRYCSSYDQFELARCLVGNDPAWFVSLANTRFGSHVVRAVLQLPGGASQQAKVLLQEHAAQLAGTKFGRHVLEAMTGKKAAAAADSD
jgi:pumilio RNA-binding family